MAGLPDPSAYAAQLRALADSMTKGWTGGGAFPVPPAMLTATNVKKVIEEIGERRAQIQALQTALGAFDTQLATLETALTPLHDWAAAWSGVEQAAVNLWKTPPKQ